MAFFARRKKKGQPEPKKKKWQLSGSSDDDGDAEDESAVPESLDCSDCHGESDVFCLACKKYFCCKDFQTKHPLDEDGSKESELSRHQFRTLVGVDATKIMGLRVGWSIKDERTQFEKERDRVDKKRRREEAEEELKRKKRMLEEQERLEHENEVASEQVSAVEDTKADAQPEPLDTNTTPEAKTQTTDSTDQARFVFVSNIAFEASLSDVRAYFRKAGRIVDMTVPKIGSSSHATKLNASHNGMVTVEFDTPEGAAAALGLTGHLMNGRPLRVLPVAKSFLPGAQATPTNSGTRSVPYKVKMCQYYERGTCRRGVDCNYAHHPRELPGGGGNVVVPSAKQAAAGKPVDGGYKW